MDPFQKVPSHAIQDCCWLIFFLQVRIYLKKHAELHEKNKGKIWELAAILDFFNRKKWNSISNRWDIHLQV